MKKRFFFDRIESNGDCLAEVGRFQNTVLIYTTAANAILARFEFALGWAEMALDQPVSQAFVIEGVSYHLRDII